MLSAIFGAFLPNYVAIKSILIYLRKSCSAFVLKMMVKLTARVIFIISGSQK